MRPSLFYACYMANASHSFLFNRRQIGLINVTKLSSRYFSPTSCNFLHVRLLSTPLHVIPNFAVPQTENQVPFPYSPRFIYVFIYLSSLSLVRISQFVKQIGYGLNDPVFEFGQRQEIICPASRPKGFWAPPNILFHG